MAVDLMASKETELCVSLCPPSYRDRARSHCADVAMPLRWHRQCGLVWVPEATSLGASHSMADASHLWKGTRFGVGIRLLRKILNHAFEKCQVLFLRTRLSDL